MRAQALDKRKEPSGQTQGARRGVILIAVACFTLVIGTAYRSRSAEMFPIRYVRITGRLDYVDVALLQQALDPLVERGFFSADLAAVREIGHKSEWIEEVKVRRVWPDIVELQVIEHIPYARWGSNGLLSEKGVFFKARTDEFFHLPLLNGPDNAMKKMVANIREMNRKLAVHKLEIGRLRLTGALGWSATLRHGAEIMIGKNKPVTVFQRFLETLSIMKGREIMAMKYVDLRYPQGFAVQWRSAAIQSRGYRDIVNPEQINIVRQVRT